MGSFQSAQIHEQIFEIKNEKWSKIKNYKAKGLNDDLEQKLVSQESVRACSLVEIMNISDQLCNKDVCDVVMKTPSREINLDVEESRDSLISSESQGKSLVLTHLNIHF